MVIDIINEIYTNLKTTLTDVTVLQNYPSTTPIFPCLVIEEISNTSNLNTINTLGEQYNDITFEINIFSDKTNKLSEVKKIRGEVDAIMSGQYRMSRSSSNSIPNYLDTDVYRYNLRYDCTIGETKQLFRR
jgi:hypothetical protein